MSGRFRAWALALASGLMVAAPAAADGIGPHWSSDQLRAARDLAPGEALRFRVRRVLSGPAGRTATDTDVVLASSFTFLKTGGHAVLYDHALCRWLAWSAAGGGLSNLNCHALPYLFGVEMQNRTGAAAPDARGASMSTYEAETELHLNAGGATLVRKPGRNGADYTAAGKRMVRTSGAAGALRPGEVHRVLRFLTLATPVHPEVRRDIAAAARLPALIELEGLGPGQNERETLAISKVDRVAYAYPLPPGLAPEIEAPGWSKDAAMTGAVRAAVAAIRDPAAHPEPIMDDLISRATAAADARQPVQVLFSYFAAVQLHAAALNPGAARARLQPMLAVLTPALKDPRAAAIWEASRLAGDGAAKGDRQAAVRTILDLGADAGDQADFRDITLGNLMQVSKDRDGWDPVLQARLPDSATTCFWRSIAVAPWPANTYHDVGIALLGEDRVDLAWLAFDLGRAVDPTWRDGVMSTIADAEQRLETTLPDFF